MSTKITPVNTTYKLDGYTLEECIIELEKYGLPKVSKLDTGWFSRIKVFVTGKGVSFDVDSDFGMRTPIEAAKQCYERLIKALDKIKEEKQK